MQLTNHHWSLNGTGFVVRLVQHIVLGFLNRERERRMKRKRGEGKRFAKTRNEKKYKNGPGPVGPIGVARGPLNFALGGPLPFILSYPYLPLTLNGRRGDVTIHSSMMMDLD